MGVITTIIVITIIVITIVVIMITCPSRRAIGRAEPVGCCALLGLGSNC